MINLIINIGKNEYGDDFSIDLAKVKHLLMSGSTGSGKSVLIHGIIKSLVLKNSPEELKLLLVDPKKVELRAYDKIPHALTHETITNHKQAILAMKWAGKEIDRRLELYTVSNCKDFDSYKGAESMPAIVIIVDEFSDLMQTSPKESELSILKIIRMGHLAGIHLILSTSRPSKNIVTKDILSSIPARIGLQTSSVTDSKYIIGTNGCVGLSGSGDILFRDGLKYIVRVQVDNVTYEEQKKLSVESIKKYKASQPIVVHESTEDDSDDMYEEVRQAIIEVGKVSTSFIQRKFGLGYSRSAKLIDMLEDKGVIGPANGAMPREVINL